MQCDKANAGQVGLLRTKQQALQQMAEIASQPTEAARTAKRKEYGLKENPNPLFKLSVNLFRYDSTSHVSAFVSL